MYDKSNRSSMIRNCQQFIPILGIRRRIVSLMLVGSLPLLLGADCGLETCDIFNCDTLPFIEELLAPDEHAEDMHDEGDEHIDDDHGDMDEDDDDMDGMTDDHDDMDGMEDEHDDMHDDDDDHMDDDLEEDTNGDDHETDAEDHDEGEEG